MTDDIATKLVGVSGDPRGERYGFLFKALGRLYPVEFRNIEGPGHASLGAVIVLDGDLAAGLAAAAEGVPAFVAMGGQGEPDKISVRQVRFGASTNLDACLRNQVMADRRGTSFCPLPVQPGDEIMASQGGHPVWLVRPKGRSACQLVGTSPPQLRETEFLFQHLNGGRSLGLLPLMHFLRQLVREVDWAGPPSRACFVFDDPSLYWRSYGFLNFRALAEHATKHNYFASVATIPLDTRWVNRGVAATLRASSPRISVLIHGNNHATHEMLPRNNRANLRAVAAQAVCRMEKLAQRHGIPYLKIMEAPYGALGDDTLRHLLVLGYEAALCTTGLLVHHNLHASWPATLGMNRSEMLGGGLPVIPRIKMSPDWKNDVLLAAFLRQPIVVAGHHYDAAHEMKTLAELADTINRLDGVTWSNMQGILRTNYLRRIEGEVLMVKMHSRHITVPIPPGIRRLCLQRPWIEEGRTEKVIVVVGSSRRIVRAGGSNIDWFELEDSDTVEITSEIENALHYSSVNLPPANAWAITRKIMMEARDRLSPMLPFVDRLRRRVRHQPL